MPITLFNTLSGEYEEFEPLDKQRITMYVCGPTVYNHIHIGNARPIVVFDTLYRLLRETYDEIIYARNITDIDDKIINSAKQNNESVESLTQKYTTQFHHDIAHLNVLEPSIEPRATEHLPQMIEMIERLIHKGFAYEAQNHVLFEVKTMPQYGRLSKRSLKDMIAGARVEVAPYKKNAADFVLWKPSLDDQPGWKSPWGRGRPGWHLECSVMAETHLGNVIDIHGGGQDLIFPHHENEIAQSCCSHDEKLFAKYWIHNGYITVDNEKMSKSLGNFFTLGDVLKQWHGETIRYSLLSTHYHKPLDWSSDTLQQAKQNLDKLYRRILEADNISEQEEPEVDKEFIANLSNNLNTPAAITRLHHLAEAKEINKLVAAAHLLGLLYEEPKAWFQYVSDTTYQIFDAAAIKKLIQEREVAREDKNFAAADEIRKKLDAAGILLEDRDGKTLWRRV